MHIPIAQHPYLFGLLSGLPVTVITTVVAWPSHSESNWRAMQISYCVILTILSSLIGFGVAEFASIALEQTYMIPRVTAIACGFLYMVPLFCMFASTHVRADSSVGWRLTCLWSPCIICWMVLPFVVTMIWSGVPARVGLGQESLVAIGMLAHDYLPYFVFSWSTIFVCTNLWMLATGNDWLAEHSANLTPMQLWKESFALAISQCDGCIVLSLIYSLAFSAAMLVLGESSKWLQAHWFDQIHF